MIIFGILINIIQYKLFYKITYIRKYNRISYAYVAVHSIIRCEHIGTEPHTCITNFLKFWGFWYVFDGLEK